MSNKNKYNYEFWSGLLVLTGFLFLNIGAITWIFQNLNLSIAILILGVIFIIDSFLIYETYKPEKKSDF